MAGLARQHIFGVPFVAGDLDGAGAFFAQRASELSAPELVAHADVHVLTRILGEADYGKGVRSFEYICPDGMPIVALMRRRCAASRLYGPDMMEQMFDCGREHALRHFLFGASEEACERLTARLSERFPGVQVVGHFCPPMGEWPEDLNVQMCRMVRECGANCVWVGLGCPKQERWLFEHRESLPPALYFAVGAAFDFHAGLVKQAPKWIRNHGFEWLWRLCREPRRLFKRYLVHNSQFVWFCLTRKIYQ